MKPKHEAKFIGSSVNPRVLKRRPLPEIIFLGRSNVGKSSLINCLVNQKNLARTSSTPGKTRLFYFYEADEKMLFVDPPGYGFAKVAKTVRNRWLKEMERYLKKAEMLLGVILIMDIRHAPTPLDYEVAAWLDSQQIPAIYVLNKADKLSRKKRHETIIRIKAELEFTEHVPLVTFSAQTKEGKKNLWEEIQAWIDKT